jgi:hypothetical protein
MGLATQPSSGQLYNRQPLTDQQIALLAIIDAGRPAPPPHFTHARSPVPPRPLHPGPGAVVWSRPTRPLHARHAGVAPSFPKGRDMTAFLFRPCSCCGRPVPIERWHDGQPGCDECNRVEAERKAELRAEWRLRIGVGLALGASIAVAGLGWAALFRWLGWW